jgi:SOS-response transcriptional repressor LexA
LGRIVGSALSRAGVHSKDLLVLSSLVESETNDIVVAQVNGSICIRRFIRYTHVIFLLPTDGQHPLSVLSSKTSFILEKIHQLDLFGAYLMPSRTKMHHCMVYPLFYD